MKKRHKYWQYSKVGAFKEGKLYKLFINGEKDSFHIELSRVQAIDLYDNLSDLIDEDLKGKVMVKFPFGKGKYRRITRL